MFDTLMHNTQILDHHFTGLKLSFTHLSASQCDELEKLSMNINQLCSSLREFLVSGEPINRVVLHELRHQLSIVSTRAQLLWAHNARECGSGAITHLETIVEACNHINMTLGIAMKRT